MLHLHPDLVRTGVIPSLAPTDFGEDDLAEWRKVMSINLDGPFICCKAIAPAMISQGYGRILALRHGAPTLYHVAGPY